ncbi:MAG: TRL domain-containing protein [Oleiphilus sp.]
MSKIINSKIMGIVAITISVLLSGCATNLFPGGPTPAGVLITNVKSPAQNLTVATDKDAKSVKTGSSTASAVAGLVAFGDSSVDAAMKQAGITKVHHVDHQINSILFGLWLENTTIVYGE